jgi:hypothetical protein
MKVLGTIILVLLLGTIVVPVGYLAWRADQPMELPQFKGYTYYQYLNWRKDALHQMALEISLETSLQNTRMRQIVSWSLIVGLFLLRIPLLGFGE